MYPLYPRKLLAQKFHWNVEGDKQKLLLVSSLFISLKSKLNSTYSFCSHETFQFNENLQLL